MKLCSPLLLFVSSLLIARAAMADPAGVPAPASPTSEVAVAAAPAVLARLRRY